MHTVDLDLIRAAGIVTSRYQNWRPEHGVPIRSTVGYPRFWRGPQLVFVKPITPFGIFGRGLLDEEVVRSQYLARLDDHAEQIVTTLTAIARANLGRPLCVMCYERVDLGEACHRRWLAEWMQDRYEIEVPEVSIDVYQSPLWI